MVYRRCKYDLMHRLFEVDHPRYPVDGVILPWLLLGVISRRFGCDQARLHNACCHYNDLCTSYSSFQFFLFVESRKLHIITPSVVAMRSSSVCPPSTLANISFNDFLTSLRHFTRSVCVIHESWPIKDAVR